MRVSYAGSLSGLVAVLFAGCTSSPPVAHPSPSPTETTVVASSELPTPSVAPTPIVAERPTVYPALPVPPGTPRCHTSQLEVAFITSGAAAGNVEEVFEMRNRSSKACWVFGFVGFQALDAAGRAVKQTVNWTTESMFGRNDPSSKILLPPGTGSLGSDNGTGHAFFDVFTDDVLCDWFAVQVASIHIWPPDEYQPLTTSAQGPGGLHFGFCDGFGLSPLEVQPHPHQE